VSVKQKPIQVARLEAVLAELTSYMSGKALPGKQKAMLRVLKHVTKDMIEELCDEEIDHDRLGAYFANMGSIIAWIGDGDDDKLPPSVREFFQARAQGIAVVRGEIEAPGVVDTPPDGLDPELSTADTAAR
jgi:hypothetical protein